MDKFLIALFIAFLTATLVNGLYRKYSNSLATIRKLRAFINCDCAMFYDKHFGHCHNKRESSQLGIFTTGNLHNCTALLPFFIGFIVCLTPIMGQYYCFDVSYVLMGESILVLYFIALGIPQRITIFFISN